MIHADLFNDNVLFLHDKLSGLIDFYFACNDAFAYDVAICLNAWCFEADKSFNATKGRALLQGYGRVRPLDDRERSVLPLLARGAALRFLLTQAIRLAAHAERCPGEAQGLPGISRQAALPSQRGLDRGLRAVSPASQQAEVEIFTDGACSGNPGPGGWGAILPHRRAASANSPAAIRPPPTTAWS